jgi:hypothetical protein
MGNQMFQYAAGYALARRQDAPLTLDLSWFAALTGVDGVTERQYALAPYDLPAQLRSTPAARRPGLLARVLRRMFPTVANGNTYQETSFLFDPGLLQRKPPVTLNGYFQSYRYFEAVEADIRAQFGTPRVMSEGTREMLARIQAVNAVCVHVRRGDYVTNAAAAAFHGLCEIDYYLQGLAHLESAAPAARECFVFSDDPQWVRENLRLPLPTTVVDINGPQAAHEDLWLMAACRDFVIANSSMSWWGAWLGTHPQKQVVAPLKWFKDKGHDTRDLIAPSWIRL